MDISMFQENGAFWPKYFPNCQVVFVSALDFPDSGWICCDVKSYLGTAEYE